MPRAQQTLLEIDLKALTHNFEYLKSKLKPETKFMAVVKAFAYGSDACEVANHLQMLNADYFAVAYVKEGVALREAGITKPILVLHPQPISFISLIDYSLEPSIYSLKVLEEFISAVTQELQTNYPIHIKFNTGLNRLGFKENQIDDIHALISKTKAIKVKSIFSHMAASEDEREKEFTKSQITSFNHISANFIKHLGHVPMCHMCNTSGILNFPEAHFDMVRSGIGLYGFGNSDLEDKNFRPIATLKSVISQIHDIKIGETVGYNRAYKGDIPIRSATIPIGHADGIGRQYGNGKGFVVINGKPAPIIGNVCMDMIMVNVSKIDCAEGDEVIIFGSFPTAVEFAKTANTISYEIITAISQRIPRVILNN